MCDYIHNNENTRT